ncbi:serine protease [Klebsiella pneumoniae]|nr:serine protease [Klebsiella pneumoniae]MCP5661184.1 serine protease [Klebsiella pneumoniae]HEI9774288.1 trypsin-like peptidase domain-containing protein [Klebsiella pneumoniae]HEO9424601.1 trypsin-like peptidase domain-containing protein [Klebsiella pneumoniae subsp. pneumoniae]
MYQTLANATFQVIAGDYRGSGFSFMREDLVVTNLHVVATCCDLQNMRQINRVILQTEANDHIDAIILHIDSGNDFAIMRLQSPLPAGRTVLQPSTGFTPTRGKKLIFAGYPHGLPQLLTNEGIISAPLDSGRFALDGMVNGGNSGGPIIDRETGETVGIVTQRRYMLADQASSFSQEISQLRQYLASVSQQGNVAIMGVNFGQMADMFGRSLQIVSDMMSQNANSGIGIGFSIQPVIEVIATIPSE